METRIQAVERKLKEECNLIAVETTEMGSYDLIANFPGSNLQRHWITTIFHVNVNQTKCLKLDGQSKEGRWRFPEEWKKENLHQFINQGLEDYGNCLLKSKHRNTEK